MMKSAKLFRQLRICGAVSIWTSLSIVSGLPATVYADGNMGDYTATPPVITASADTPNVLVIIDNSNSMDEAPSGEAVGSDNPGSKSEIARNAIKGLVTTFTGKVRMGLMAYQQSGVQHYYLSNSPYDVSYDPANYDPGFTGPRDSTTKRMRIQRVNGDPGYVYYNVALPFYHSNYRDAEYCYSGTADASNDFVNMAGPSGTPGVCTPDVHTNCHSYYCWRHKTNDSDTLPAPINDGPSQGFNTSLTGGIFYPTDSDIAWGINDFGKHMADYPVGETWFSNSSPGKGYLHVPIANLDATQAALINAKLATSQFTTATDTPLRNAGLTPLQGTLQTANTYFTDATHLPVAEGGPATPPAASTCGDHDFVILVTDGMPSTDASGNPISDTATALADTAAAAATLYANGVKTYVVGFALPYSVDPTQLDTIASSGGTNTAYSASNASELDTVFDTIFNDILNRTSSGTGAAVVSNSSSGVGALYQALYTPAVSTINPSEGSSRNVSWAGRLHSVFVDSYGYLREDSNQNDQLDDYSTDLVIGFEYNATEKKTKIQRYSSASSTEPTSLAASGLPVDIEGLKTIWDARDGLDSVTDYVTQRTYSDSATTGRYIVTNRPYSNTLIDFTAANFPDTPGDNMFRYLGGVAQADAPDLINYIRGYECEDISDATAKAACSAAYRNRTIDWDLDSTNERWLLGDIIHSTPLVVGAPADDYDIKYGDTSYNQYRQRYSNRRQVVYVGGNDGMLHAFNAGFWDTTASSFETIDPTSSGRTAHPLGTELWAYVPGDLLPHLQWLADPSYAHVYYVDGPPQAFDVNIFTPDSTHPNGWGTILVVGMRFGGGPFSLDTDGDSTNDITTHSVYSVFDITDPEQPPELLRTISSYNATFTTSVPQVIKERVPGTGNDWDNPSTNNWKLVFAAGPTKLSDASSTVLPRYKVYNLKTGTSGSSGLGVSDNGFGGDPKVVDWDNDFVDDAVYFGVVTGTPSTQGGRIVRVDLSDNSVHTLYSPGSPFVSAPSVSLDVNGGHWIHMGSGRLFTVGDNTTTDQQRFVGIKEPLDSDGEFTWSSVSSSDLSNHTSLQVFADASILPNPFTIGSTYVSTYYDVLDAMKTVDGWYKMFEANGTDPSTRNLSAAVQVSKILLYTDYTPSGDVCSPEGTSRLNALDYRTGTAMPHGALGFTSSTQNNGYDLSLESIDLGTGVASTPVVHSGSGDNSSVTVFTQKTTGEITRTVVGLPPTTGGRKSWREIYLDDSGN